jgi:hypothetical protein
MTLAQYLGVVACIFGIAIGLDALLAFSTRSLPPILIILAVGIIVLSIMSIQLFEEHSATYRAGSKHLSTPPSRRRVRVIKDDWQGYSRKTRCLLGLFHAFFTARVTGISWGGSSLFGTQRSVTA